MKTPRFILILTAVLAYAVIASCSPYRDNEYFGDPPLPELCFCSPDGYAAYINWAAETYPDICTAESIGRSADRKDIWALEISDNIWDDEYDEPAVLVNGGIHGNEQLSGGVVLKLAEYLLYVYSFDPLAELEENAYIPGGQEISDVKDLVENYRIHLIPAINPDGIAADRRYNGNWVDINRNFGYNWYEGEYHDNGDEPFDQPESRAIRDYMSRNLYALSLNLHTAEYDYNAGIYAPWDAIRTSRASSISEFESKYLPNLPYINEVGNTYKNTTLVSSSRNILPVFDYSIGADWYEMYGSMGDWALGELGTLSYTIELYGMQNFTVNDGWRLKEVWESHRNSMLDIIKKAGTTGTAGRVVNGTSPIKGAEVRLEYLDGPSSRTFVPRTYDRLKARTNEGGYFRILTQPGNYNITITAPGETLPGYSSGLTIENSPVEIKNYNL